MKGVPDHVGAQPSGGDQRLGHDTDRVARAGVAARRRRSRAATASGRHVALGRLVVVRLRVTGSDLVVESA